MRLNFKVNGELVTLDVPPDMRLLEILREELKLTGTKEGCGEGECGACTVIMDNKAVHACLVIACQLTDKEIITIEGLGANGELNLLQACFVQETAIQCGYCTTGMIMSAKALLLTNPKPTQAEIAEALSGNICRCSGYVQIIRAVKKAAEIIGGGVDE